MLYKCLACVAYILMSADVASAELSNCRERKQNLLYYWDLQENFFHKKVWVWLILLYHSHQFEFWFVSGLFNISYLFHDQLCDQGYQVHLKSAEPNEKWKCKQDSKLMAQWKTTQFHRFQTSHKTFTTVHASRLCKIWMPIALVFDQGSFKSLNSLLNLAQDVVRILREAI